MRRAVAIVGGGAMGAATACFLARQGVEVTVLEQFSPGHDRGSSHGRSRIFRLAYRDQGFVPLALRALGLWRSVEEDAGVELLTMTGGVNHGDPVALDEVETGLRAHRLACTRLAAAEAHERWPGFRFDGEVLWHPEAGRIDADATVRTLLRRAGELGADVRFGARVEAVRPRPGGVEVVAGGERFDADAVVLAAGAWLPGLAGPLEVPLPSLTVTQEQPAYFPARETAEWPSFVHHSPTPHYGLWTPGLGLKVGEHGGGQVVDPDARPPVDGERVSRLGAYVAEWLPGADAEPVRVDSCLYTSTPDESFVLRRTGSVVVCSACSGHGFKFVPAIGERVAALALEQ